MNVTKALAALCTTAIFALPATALAQWSPSPTIIIVNPSPAVYGGWGPGVAATTWGGGCGGWGGGCGAGWWNAGWGGGCGGGCGGSWGGPWNVGWNGWGGGACIWTGWGWRC
jgi:hypothetical protein